MKVAKGYKKNPSCGGPSSGGVNRTARTKGRKRITEVILILCYEVLASHYIIQYNFCNFGSLSKFFLKLFLNECVKELGEEITEISTSLSSLFCALTDSGFVVTIL